MCMSCVDRATRLLVSACVSWWISTGSGKNPPDPSAGLTRPQHLCRAASTNNNSARGYKQGEAHQSTIQNHFKLTRSCSPPQVKSKVIFLSLFFGWSSSIANCNLQSAAVSQYGAHCFFLFGGFGFSVFRVDRISKILTFPHCSWSESSSRVFV